MADEANDGQKVALTCKHDIDIGGVLIGSKEVLSFSCHNYSAYLINVRALHAHAGTLHIPS